MDKTCDYWSKSMRLLPDSDTNDKQFFRISCQRKGADHLWLVGELPLLGISDIKWRSLLMQVYNTQMSLQGRHM